MGKLKKIFKKEINLLIIILKLDVMNLFFIIRVIEKNDN